MNQMHVDVRQVSVYLAAEERDVTRWAVYLGGRLLVTFEDEERARRIARDLGTADDPEARS